MPYFYKLFLFILFLCTLACSPHQPTHPTANPIRPTINEWDPIRQTFNLKTDPANTTEQIAHILNGSEFRTQLNAVEDFFVQDAYSTQCGQIEGISKPQLTNLIARNSDGTKQNIPGVLYILKHRPKTANGAISAQFVYSWITLPPPGPPLPLLLWAHELNHTGYNLIVNRLNHFQSQSIIVQPAYPGECLKDKFGTSLACSSSSTDGLVVYRKDINTMLSVADCIRTLNTFPTVEEIQDLSNPAVPLVTVANPFQNRFLVDINRRPKQILYGYSYGGGVALLTAAKAGALIKRFGISDSTIRTHLFHALGAIAPFGSLLTGTFRERVQQIVEQTPANQPPAFYDLYRFDFLKKEFQALPPTTPIQTFITLIASREASFYSQFIPHALQDFSPVPLSRFSIFYDPMDKFLNDPTLFTLLPQTVYPSCNLEFFQLEGSDHTPYNQGHVKSFWTHGILSPHPEQNFRVLQDSWLRSL